MDEQITERARLRHFEEGDAPSLARYANNRSVWANLRDLFPHPYALEDAERFIENASGTVYCIEVDGEAAGGIGLHPEQDVERFSAELGYWLAEPFWGHGIMTAAVDAVTAHGLGALELHRIFAMPYAFNIGSRRVLEKAGYVQEALLREHVFKDGRFVDQYLYARVVGQDAAPPRHALTILAVPDLTEAARFYEAALGWPRVESTEVYVELEHPDGQRLGIYDAASFGAVTGAPAAAPPGGRATTGTELYFYVADLEEATRRMKAAGAAVLSVGAKRPWGDRAAYFADPFGNVLVMATPRV